MTASHRCLLLKLLVAWNESLFCPSYTASKLDCVFIHLVYQQNLNLVWLELAEDFKFIETLASHLPTSFDKVPNYQTRFTITTKSINVIVITLFDFDKFFFFLTFPLNQVISPRCRHSQPNLHSEMLLLPSFPGLVLFGRSISSSPCVRLKKDRRTPNWTSIELGANPACWQSHAKFLYIENNWNCKMLFIGKSTYKITLKVNR